MSKFMRISADAEQYSCLAIRLNIFVFFFFWSIIRKRIQNWKKTFHYFVYFDKTNPLIYNALLFDQYSRLTISSNIFRFSANNSKTNLKKLSISL